MVIYIAEDNEKAKLDLKKLASKITSQWSYKIANNWASEDYLRSIV